jgi:lysophospholipase L1-like esterase
MNKKAWVFSASLLFSIVVFAQTQTAVNLSSTINRANSRGFYRYLPADYNSSTKNYPLIIWVHGAGQIGQGNAADLPKVLEWGTPKIISEGGFPSSFSVGSEDFSFIVISPQFIGWPSGGNIAGILSYVMNNYRVDPERVYLMGISAGGGGVWQYASASVANSNNLAAIIPFCGATDASQVLAGRIAAANLPVWAFHNTNDGTVPVAYSRNWRNLINAYQPTPNPLAKLTEFPVVSSNAVIAHECWSLATLPSYKPEGINIYEWMLRYKKRMANINAQPIANAGQDQGVVLPAAAVLNGSSSSDPDGVIVSYSWTKLSGPSSYSFTDSTLANTSVSNLSQGTYQFRLTVTDNLGGTSNDIVVVNVYQNLPPGAQQRILIDVGNSASYGGVITNSPNLNGNVWNNMTDARPGVRVANALTTNNQLSGIALEVINRIDGTYSTNSTGMGNGNTAGTVNDYPASATTDHALIHKSEPNGLWRIRGLDSSKVYTVKFWGTRSNTTAARSAEIKRGDDNIWKTYNATGNINYNNAAVFNITGKTQMDFNIRTKSGSDFSALNVIDISYGSGNDSTVNPPPQVNLPPVAKAGVDTILRLPTDSVTLRGCNSFDPESARLKYKWRKISGPASLQIIVDTVCSPKVKSMIAGTYIFELTVTDTAGLTGKDSVSVTLNSLLTTSWPAQVTPLCSQPFKVVVVGSSTAFGTGADPIDSSWVRKFTKYLSVQNPLIQVINISTLGLTSWDVSPSGTIVPSGYIIDTLRNITKALSYNPDVIILNLPSNDIARGITTNDIHTNYLRITALCDNANVPIWVTTTQPRDRLSPAERILLMQLRDWINTTYGNKSVDFWSTVANADGIIDSVYSAGDGVHLNNYGHHVLFTRIVAEKVWDTVCKRKNLAPIAKAGNDTTISTEPFTFNLNANNSFDPDGTIIGFSWRIVGNSSGSLSAANSANALFSTPVTGIYLIELSVTDNLGKVGLDSISILVNTNNIPPVADAGIDQAITLPTASLNLNGAGSFDSNGIIVSYRWKKISGAGDVTISDTTAPNTTVHFASANIYQFELTVVDNGNVFDKDTVTITVNPVMNLTPVAIAGPNQSITLPTKIALLNAVASYDDDGSISSYKWRKIIGANATLTDSSAALTNVSFVTSGLYGFELTVTDNLGAVGKDTVLVTVNPDPNVAPVANAGADQNIRFPLNKLLVDGRSSYDPEGSVLSYSWQYLSGPLGSQILTATKDTSSINFLSAGTYTFRLTVTDAGGLSNGDNITINVLPVTDVTKRIKVNVFGGTNTFADPQWNNWNLNAGVNSNKFLYDDLSLSNINASISSPGQIRDNGSNYASTSTVCPPAILRYISFNTSYATLTLKGFNTNKKYNFEFYASRINSPGNSSVFKIGNNFDTISTNNNINDYAKFYGIIPDNNGNVIVVISRIGTYHYFAGFMITEIVPDGLAGRNSGSILNTTMPATLFMESVGGDAIAYPNPFQNNVSLNISALPIGPYLVQFTDAAGKIVLQQQQNKQPGATLSSVKAGSLEMGVYYLQIISKTYKTTHKIIKL